MNEEIEFKHVWFAYHTQEWGLKDVSFKLKIGETGAVKTKTISLISGFYQINLGEILIDDVNINEYKLGDLRRRVVVVL